MRPLQEPNTLNKDQDLMKNSGIMRIPGQHFSLDASSILKKWALHQLAGISAIRTKRSDVVGCDCSCVIRKRPLFHENAYPLQWIG